MSDFVRTEPIDPRKLDRRKLLLTALGGMKAAGLAYAAWPDSVEDLRIKADVYVDAIVRLSRDGGEGKLLAHVGPATARAIDRAKAFPSASDFADLCREIHKELYRRIGVEVLGPKGDRMLVTAEVKVTASDDHVRRVKARLKADALSDGCREIPALVAPVPTEESRARMRKMLGWEGRDAQR